MRATQAAGCAPAGMDATALDADTVAAIEAAESRAWADLYAAAPREWAAAAGVGSAQIGGALVLRWAASGRRYFSRAIGLGAGGAASEATIEAMLGWWSEHGITMFLMQSMPGCRPPELEAWLRGHGLEPFDAQDRIVRGGEPMHAAPAGPQGRELSVEKVGPECADEWSGFLQRVYRLDTGPWLPALIGRAGWHQYLAREQDEIVAARGMHVERGGLAWLGMDAPVPGLMTDDYEADAAICARIVEDGLRLGARGFIADIEAPSVAMDTPAYEHFARLGFRRPYVRTHWTSGETLA
jgi:hypothetical protein